MKKSILFKIVSLILIMTFVCNTSIFSFAAIETSETPVAEYNPSGIEEFGEATYYHNYTDDYRITIGLLSDGRYDIAYLETENPNLIYHSVVFIENMEQPESFEKIEEMVCDGRVDLKTMDINREVLLTRSGDDDANVIGLDLEADRGEPYSDKYIDSLSGGGKTVSLYESMYFDIRDKAIEDFTLKAGLTVAVVATTLKITVAQVTILLKDIIKLVGSEYKLSQSTGVHSYNASVVYYREVRSGNISPYRASRELKYVYYVASGLGTCVHDDNVRDIHDDDFYDTQALLEKGLSLL